MVEADHDRRVRPEPLAQRGQQGALRIVVVGRHRRAVQQHVRAVDAPVAASTGQAHDLAHDLGASGGRGPDCATTAGTNSQPAAVSTSIAPASSLRGPTTSRWISSPTAKVWARKSASVVEPRAKEFGLHLQAGEQHAWHGAALYGVEGRRHVRHHTTAAAARSVSSEPRDRPSLSSPPRPRPSASSPRPRPPFRCRRRRSRSAGGPPFALAASGPRAVLSAGCAIRVVRLLPPSAPVTVPRFGDCTPPRRQHRRRAPRRPLDRRRRAVLVAEPARRELLPVGGRAAPRPPAPDRRRLGLDGQRRAVGFGCTLVVIAGGGALSLTPEPNFMGVDGQPACLPGRRRRSSCATRPGPASPSTAGGRPSRSTAAGSPSPGSAPTASGPASSRSSTSTAGRSPCRASRPPPSRARATAG